MMRFMLIPSLIHVLCGVRRRLDPWPVALHALILGSCLPIRNCSRITGMRWLLPSHHSAARREKSVDLYLVFFLRAAGRIHMVSLVYTKRKPTHAVLRDSERGTLCCSIRREKCSSRVVKSKARVHGLQGWGQRLTQLKRLSRRIMITIWQTVKLHSQSRATATRASEMYISTWTQWSGTARLFIEKQCYTFKFGSWNSCWTR